MFATSIQFLEPKNSNDTQQDLYQQQVQQTRGQSQYSNNKPVKIIRLRMQMVHLDEMMMIYHFIILVWKVRCVYDWLDKI